MVIMSGTATVLQQFVSGLKSRNEDTRAKSAKDLQHYVTTELREVRANIKMDVIDASHEDITPTCCKPNECFATPLLSLEIVHLLYVYILKFFISFLTLI